MNAIDSQSGPCCDPADPLETHPLETLGRLLRGHTWRDSRDWASALDRLSRLSEDDLKRLIDTSAEPGPTMVPRTPVGGR